MIFRISAAAVCVLILAGCEQLSRSPNATAVLTAPSSLTMAVDVPFTATLSGEVTIGFGPANIRNCPSGFTSISDASGKATHLGLTTMHSDHCLSLETGAITGGIMVLRAANGDEIHATYTGWSAPPPPNVGDPIRVGATVTFSGGTGRFVNASGTAEIAGEAVWQGFGATTLPARWEFTGQIRY